MHGYLRHGYYIHYWMQSEQHQATPSNTRQRRDATIHHPAFTLVVTLYDDDQQIDICTHMITVY